MTDIYSRLEKQSHKKRFQRRCLINVTISEEEGDAVT